jgi:hypothetical protein
MSDGGGFKKYGVIASLLQRPTIVNSRVLIGDSRHRFVNE